MAWVKDEGTGTFVNEVLYTDHVLMMSFISLQISKCDVCQHMNHKMTTGTPELHPIPVKSPWHQIGIDFVGPLSPEADDGSRYIFTGVLRCTFLCR